MEVSDVLVIIPELHLTTRPTCRSRSVNMEAGHSLIAKNTDRIFLPSARLMVALILLASERESLRALVLDKYHGRDAIAVFSLLVKKLCLGPILAAASSIIKCFDFGVSHLI